MSEVAAFLLGLLPTVITGAVAYYIQRAQKKRDEKLKKRADARKNESLLSLEVTMAAAKLSYACAVAIKRGSHNGEMEEAMNELEIAKDKYYKFIDEQAKEHIF